jgi:gamma-glutamyltranspeptidase/glutathione hydrolase
MVPGLVAGLDELWRRFGRLPWAKLWEPAIHLAERGYRLTGSRAYSIAASKDLLLATPDGCVIFAPGGQLPGEGELFRQPALAATLTHIAEEGGRWFYEGPWATRCVETVRAAGGVLGIDDLARYQATWEAPHDGDYLGHRITTTSGPHAGGRQLLHALGIAEALDLHERPHPAGDGRSMVDQVLAGQHVLSCAGIDADPESLGPDSLSKQAALLDRPHAAAIAQAIRARREPSPTGADGGSHNVIAADRDGLIIAGIHTSNSPPWGRTGLFIDGVPLNSSGASLRLHLAEPGGRCFAVGGAYIVQRGSQVVLAAAAIGRGLFAANFQNVMNVVAYGMTADASVRLPRWGVGPVSDHGEKLRAVPVDNFDSAVLDALARVCPVTGPTRTDDRGQWTALDVADDFRAVLDPRGVAYRRIGRL